MRDASSLSLLATEVVFLTFVVIGLTLLFMQALRLLSLQTVTTTDGFSTSEAPSTKMRRNVVTSRRFHCPTLLSAVIVATICGHCYSASRPGFSMVDGLSESFSVLDKCDTNCERMIYFYMIDSPETSGNLLEGILENLGILGTWLTWVTRTGNSVTPPGREQI